jgi:hypothetical protein
MAQKSTPTRQRPRLTDVSDLEGGEQEAYSPKAKRKTTMWRSDMKGDDAELSEFQRTLETVMMQAFPYRWHILCAIVFLVGSSFDPLSILAIHSALLVGAHHPY